MSIAVRAFVVGYTGETGKALVKFLARDPRYESVKLIGRRHVEVDYGVQRETVAGKFTQHVIDFDHLEEYQVVFEETDVGFCALGTTIGKSGAKLMRKIDHDYVLQICELAVGCGCKEMHVVSSKGADPKSAFFYPRLKGEIEEDLKANCIFPNYLAIYRPGILMGPREHWRAGESVVKFFLKPIATFFPTWATTPFTTLAQALSNAPFSLRSVMRDEARKPGSSVQMDDLKVLIVENPIIFKLASEPVPLVESNDQTRVDDT